MVGALKKVTSAEPYKTPSTAIWRRSQFHPLLRNKVQKVKELRRISNRYIGAPCSGCQVAQVPAALGM